MDDAPPLFSSLLVDLGTVCFDIAQRRFTQADPALTLTARIDVGVLRREFMAVCAEVW